MMVLLQHKHRGFVCSEQPQNSLEGCSAWTTSWASCSKWIMEQLWKFLWMIFNLTPAAWSFSPTSPACRSLPAPWRKCLLWFQLKNWPEVVVMLRFSFAAHETQSVMNLQLCPSHVLLFQWQLAGLSEAPLISSLAAQLCLYHPLFGWDPSQVSTAVTCNPYQNFLAAFSACCKQEDSSADGPHTSLLGAQLYPHHLCAPNCASTFYLCVKKHFQVLGTSAGTAGSIEDWKIL